MNTRDQQTFLFRFGAEAIISNQPKMRANSHSALDFNVMQNVLHKANLVASQEIIHLNENEIVVWNSIIAGNQLSQTIISCDLPSDKENNADMVRLVQDNADAILRNPTLSWLMRVLRVAMEAKQLGHGNCQEKAFFGFACMLLNLSEMQQLQSLRLATFNNHFIVIVNERFLMDPWLNLAFPLKSDNIDKNIDYVFNNFGLLVNYFEITFDKKNYTCITHEVVEDAESKIDNTSNKDLTNCIHYLNTNVQELLLSPVTENKKRKHTSEKNKLTTDGTSPPPFKKQKNTEAPTPGSTASNALETMHPVECLDSINPDTNMTKATDDECDLFFDAYDAQFDDSEVKQQTSLQQSSNFFRPQQQAQFNIQPGLNLADSHQAPSNGSRPDKSRYF